MFRGSALIDDNIMAMYTTPASEAKHYVQYDQGKALYVTNSEDRFYQFVAERIRKL